jgi:hypothetical protein
MGFANFIADVGHSLHLPELGISEALGGKNTYTANIGGQTVTGQARTYDEFLRQAQAYQGSQPSVGAGTDTGGGGTGGGTGYAGGGTGYTAEDVSFLNDQESRLRALLGRTDTALTQSLQRNEDDYNTNAGQATKQKDDMTIDENKAKQGAYDTIDRNANTGFRSLAQIIGRASGTGSSAFREALPDAVGKDTSSKRQAATTTHDTNLSKIDASFEDVIADLLRQKKANEENARTKVEEQRQGIQGQMADVAGKRAQAAGGGYAAVKAAQAPMDAAIENSRNAVEGFFNTFRSPYTPKTVSADRSAYNTDRSVVNAKSGPQATDDPTNPYAALLRKRLAGTV